MSLIAQFHNFENDQRNNVLIYYCIVLCTVRNCISVCKACQTQASVLQGLKVLTSLEAIEIKEDNHLVMARIDLVRLIIFIYLDFNHQG